jgi:hypothetical protein
MFSAYLSSKVALGFFSLHSETCSGKKVAEKRESCILEKEISKLF